MDYLHHPFPSKRTTTIAKKGMVATSHPLAAQAGLEILQKGGNAIDAAIATAAALTVVEPTSNGIGGDAFALVWMKDKLYGLNGSGPSPQNISKEALVAKGLDKIPMYAVVPVTVPGVPASWAALAKRFGKLSLQETLTPAIRYAEEGHPISVITGQFWQMAYQKFQQQCTSLVFQPWFDTFSIAGRMPEIGEIWRSPGHARTLRLIAETDAKAFYQGELADEIDAFMREHDGYLTKQDLANYEPEWVDPISVNYKGYDVWEIPPNGQGIVAQMALNIYQHSTPKWHDAETVHQQIEAMKLAYTDGKAYVTAPEDMPITTDELLSQAYGASRFAEITDKALTPKPYPIPKGGTVYLATADDEGNMVSFIQSNYMGFGSGVVVPNTGIALQNRGYDFSMDETHPNFLKPNKKVYHTIIPGFLTKDNQAVGPFGVMGGYMQPQGHFQVVTNTVDFAMNPQAALDMPRWQWIGEKTIHVEPHFPNDLALALKRKGHDIAVMIDGGTFGRGQIIWRDITTGVLYGGTESRTDGAIAAW
ncbi:gamma-glutamyltransferase [Lysinibacillus alkalisoli]|uniref:Gamma-glutamyltransferase n=1 Tax=Lysinibacillus alkalisoli TaxID=1911548 RepID=A0A917G132_9BACI|nr:gamma-glutamyltransferase family protein [Lysinibacillus alkalisoli]GGG17208.1 gamma-glutamyltransferase [Lysinibacillus alkalisoli]